jgi:hypothetical protein
MLSSIDSEHNPSLKFYFPPNNINLNDLVDGDWWIDISSLYMDAKVLSDSFTLFCGITGHNSLISPL